MVIEKRKGTTEEKNEMVRYRGSRRIYSMNESLPRVVMAFDFGVKNIGIAIGQEITRTASTFYSITAVDGQPNWIELDKIISEWQPHLFVVGDPLNMDGSVSRIKTRTDSFASKISSRYGVPFELMDERLSTKEATERLKMKGNMLLKFVPW